NSDGVHTVYYRAYDVAGNPSPEQSVKVRIDVSPPTGSFEARDAADPTKFVADVVDAYSGVVSGTIHYRSQSGDWQSLPPTDEGGLRLRPRDRRGRQSVQERAADDRAERARLRHVRRDRASGDRRQRERQLPDQGRWHLAHDPCDLRGQRPPAPGLGRRAGPS